MEMYPDSHLQWQDSDKTLSISDLESKMSHQEEEKMFHLSPSESDREILQQSVKDSSEATTAKVAKSFKSSSSVTDPSLARQIRILNAKIEELQQDQLNTVQEGRRQQGADGGEALQGAGKADHRHQEE
jgi:hypothetical protein